MEKINIGVNVFIYPMPMTLIGVQVEGKANFMAAAWITRVNAAPPLMAVAIGKSHATAAGIQLERCFSINLPAETQLEVTDYCGLASGRKVDKSRLFQTFYGDLKTAPMIAACPLCFECRLVETVELPTNFLFIGEVMAAYTEEKFLTSGQPDPEKMRPFVLTMPDNRYWRVGDQIGRAWHDGKGFPT